MKLTTMQTLDPPTSPTAAPPAARRATTRAGSVMQAIRHDRYGALDDLALCEVARPVVGDDEVLVRVDAAGLHIGDVFGARGTPLLMRVITGLLRPRHGIPGFDAAGRVEAVGKHLTSLAPGDEVFGAADATCAGYVAAKAARFAKKPARQSFAHAAAMPIPVRHSTRESASL